MTFTIDQIEWALEQKIQTKRTYAQLAFDILGDTAGGESLRSAIRQYKKDIPEASTKLFKDPLYLPDINTLVIADLHAPYQNKRLLQTAIDLAKAASVTNVDIAGDLHDFNSLSSMNKGEPTTEYPTDMQYSRQILYVLAQSFTTIHIMSGNHDEYFVKKKGTTFEDMIYDEVLKGALRDQIIATNYDYIFRGENWLIGHLSQYDPEPGLLASQLSDKYQRNVLVGHDHILGVKSGKSGYIGASIGCMLTPDRFYYKERRLNTFPHFMLGFAMIINRKLHLFNEQGNSSFNGEIKDFSYWTTYFKEGRFNE